MGVQNLSKNCRDEGDAFQVSPASKARQLQRLQKQAASMGLALVAAG